MPTAPGSIHAKRPWPFLTAEWRFLAMINFSVDPELLAPLVPRGTTLDFFRGETFISLVGFLFQHTKVFGVSIPFHRDFEELNLRFYVVREEEGEVRRGVVFIRELVPRWAVSTLARLIYNENYFCTRMRHRIAGWSPDTPSTSSPATPQVTYEWQAAGRWHSLHMDADRPAEPLEPGSHEQFIAEHYWGYCRQRDGGTIEYRVDHPPWRIWRNVVATIDWDVELAYGTHFAPTLSRPPTSTFLAEGSAIALSRPKRITFC